MLNRFIVLWGRNFMNIENDLVIRCGTQDDYDFISKMLDYSNMDIKGEIGYPRCDDINELLSEIELYDNSLEESICIIYHMDKPVALSGYLYTPGENEGYLIGPICTQEYYCKKNLKAMIELVLNSRKNMFNKLEAVISINNILLNESYLELGWTLKETQREMCFDINTPQNYSSKYDIKEINENDTTAINDAFVLLDKTFKWNGNRNKIDELLKEEYKLGIAVDKNNNVCGVVSWAYVDDVEFSRLEYLVVKEEYRKKGIGESMINYVINDSIVNKMKRIYLSTSENNDAANLYRKIGFYDTIVSNIYGTCFFHE